LTTEEDLIRNCQAGDHKAYHALYKQFSPVMYAISLRYARSKADADDILQEGFSKIFLSLKQYEHRGSFEGWMKRIVVNCALAYYRKKSAVDYVDDYHDHIQSKVETYTAVEEIGRQDLLNMIQQLPPGCRTVFNLYAVEGYAHKEIAEQLGISEGTSKSQLSDARKRLRALVERSMIVAQSKQG
jgi:RNA polymerase sigma-70 factor (ECF subfamily)